MTGEYILGGEGAIGVLRYRYLFGCIGEVFITRLLPILFVYSGGWDTRRHVCAQSLLFQLVAHSLGTVEGGRKRKDRKYDLGKPRYPLSCIALHAAYERVCTQVRST